MRHFVTIALASIAFGCATPGPPPLDESQLLAAGFKVVPAKTQQQFEHLQSLPPNKLTEWQNTGRHYFMYPDVAKRQLYVGRPQEYQAYLRLAPGAGPTLAQQSASDMAHYAKQDAGMGLLTTRDQNDPYWFWGLDDLGWR
jgi:hypothetical protein